MGILTNNCIFVASIACAIKPVALMKKYIIFFLAMFLAALSSRTAVTVCGTAPNSKGVYTSPYIKRGTITWSKSKKTLTLDNAIVEYSSGTPYDGIQPIHVTEDATIVIHGDCRLITTGFVALSCQSHFFKMVTITGDGSLYTSSRWIDIFPYITHLTIKNITLRTVNGISENSDGLLVSLTFDNVLAYIKGYVERIGEGINLKNCAISYPMDAYIGETDYGCGIFCGNGDYPDLIIISGDGRIPGDTNGDGEINIADINTIIDAILNGTYDVDCDCNGDGEINIADVNSVIDIILGY